ncbi:hypothetical protein H257_00250 [Aphanomyces astaci]|uniref:Uncharacterized protein n=1 Tax=Aphanomyces astaci TaxID=112090 RepID=W4HAZ3_APHAT|nr:hypothetical protein H257_00250 [Aphanomyces astaci]ETV88736.1 hypothetical protein H257_00250 [Aphanomyces astaci]|eukprot:XP_009821136.1 hypothetical protein H257_00250 [Aphanomyces astaci]
MSSLTPSPTTTSKLTTATTMTPSPPVTSKTAIPRNDLIPLPTTISRTAPATTITHLRMSHRTTRSMLSRVKRSQSPPLPPATSHGQIKRAVATPAPHSQEVHRRSNMDIDDDQSYHLDPAFTFITTTSSHP